MARIVTTSSRRKTSNISAVKIIVTVLCVAVAVLVYFVFLQEKQEEVNISVNGSSNDADSVLTVQTGLVDNEEKKVKIENTKSLGNVEAQVNNGVSKFDVTEKPISNNTEELQYAEVPDETQCVKHFNGQTEHLLALMMSADDRHGMPPPPISPINSEIKLERDFLIALTNDIVIYESDDAKLIALKERVAEAKLNLAEIIKNGGSITNAIKEYQDWVNEGAAIRVSVVQEYKRLKKLASQEEADNYLKAANEALDAQGITPITVGRSKDKKARNAAKRHQLEVEGYEL